MIAGITIEPLYIELGGLVLLVVTALQVAMGLRWVNLPRAYHLKVHKWLGVGLLGVAVFHGLAGLVYLNAWTLL